MLKSVGLSKIEGYYRQILHKYAELGHFYLYLICSSPWRFGNFPHSSRSMDALDKSVPYIYGPICYIWKILSKCAESSKF